MKRTFVSSLAALGAMVLLSALMIGIGVATPEETLINNIAMGAFVTLLCSSPLVMLIAAVSGIGTLINHFSGQEKRKREFVDLGFDEDYQLEQIMKRLTPEQQIYLENRLRNSRLGISSDGEMVSMEELFGDFDPKEKRL